MTKDKLLELAAEVYNLRNVVASLKNELYEKGLELSDLEDTLQDKMNDNDETIWAVERILDGEEHCP